VREFTPIQEISEDSRPYSIFGQRSSPPSSVLLGQAAASSLRTPSCIQITAGAVALRSRRDDRQQVLRGTEHVDQVDRLGDVGQARVDGLAEQAEPARPGLTGIMR